MHKKKLWPATLLFMFTACMLVYFFLPNIIEVKVSVLKEFLVPADRDSGCADVIYGNYCELSLPSDAERSNQDIRLVTLCTQGTIDFLHHVPVLCERWGGPISVAVYSPGTDYPDARTLVHALRQCDFCVRRWVTWHLYRKVEPGDKTAFDTDHSVVTEDKDCMEVMGFNWIPKKRFTGPYPINVGRNLAKKRTRTPYVFSLDIELYPSANVLTNFERMIRSSKNLSANEPQVWVLPVFEVQSGFSVPRTKFHLKQLFDRREAVSFHMYKCNPCHKIPNLQGWINQQSQWKSEASSSIEVMKVWRTVKRNKKDRLGDWEPFFIGTREDPEFDIRLTWEGKQNKMQMAYEMCLKDYNFHIVLNSFLVHAPGITIYNITRDRKRMKYIRENNKLMKLVKKDLEKIYGSNNDC